MGRGRKILIGVVVAIAALVDRTRRVIAVDLLGHGGSEKPTSGYTISNQADLVAQALARLGARGSRRSGTRSAAQW